MAAIYLSYSLQNPLINLVIHSNMRGIACNESIKTKVAVLKE